MLLIDSKENIKPLELCFVGRGEVKGFLFRQIRVTKLAFLYEVITDGTKHYEVFRKVVNYRFACISYPSSKSFGKWAWCFKSKRKAILKFNLISENNE